MGDLTGIFFVVFLLAQSVLVTLADPVVSLLFQSVLIFSSFFFSFYIVGGVMYNICPMPDIRSNSRISAYLCLPKCNCLLVMLFLRAFFGKGEPVFFYFGRWTAVNSTMQYNEHFGAVPVGSLVFTGREKSLITRLFSVQTLGECWNQQGWADLTCWPVPCHWLSCFKG